MLGDTVRRARYAKDWSIEQLSKRSGVPGRLIREMEGGRNAYVPSEANTVLLGETFRIPVGVLLGKGSSCSSGGAIEGANRARSERVKHEELKFVLYRELGDGYGWRLRSATGETVAASGVGHPNKSACEADMRAFTAEHHLDVEVLDATARDLRP